MSTLNPNAPLFVPASFLATEDFSPEWWSLIHTSPAFRDYWLGETYENVEEEFNPFSLDFSELVDFEEFEDMEANYQEWSDNEDRAPRKQANGAVRDSEKDVLLALAGVDVNDVRSQQRTWREPLKHHEKISNRSPRSPRKGGNNQFRIQQPRA